MDPSDARPATLPRDDDRPLGDHPISPTTPGTVTGGRSPQPAPAGPVVATGVVATGAGLAVSAVVAQIAAPAAMPITAIGEVLISILPGPVVNFGKSVLGFADKPVLLLIITVAALVLGAIAALLERRRANLGWAVMAPVAVLCAVCAVINTGNPTVSLIPTAVTVLVAVPVMRWLLGRMPADYRGDGVTRRGFLQRLGITAVGAAVVTGIDRAVAASGVTGPAAPEVGSLPTAPNPATIPAGADLGVPGLSPYVTPTDDFYRIDTALVVPRVDVNDWRLRITGMVEREIELDWATLTGRPLIEHVTTLTCVSNEVGGGLAGNARWLGVRIRDVLAEAGPRPGADMVLSRSVDGFTAGTPLEVLTDENRESLFAFGMNGEPLPFEHGYPVRMVVPGLYGYVSATKWVTELKVTTFAEDQGYWTPLGWSALGPIKLASRIDVPGRDAAPGDVVVAGVAWAQHTGIQAVQVQVDDGPWADAELADVTGPDTWRQWRWVWPGATAGDHTLRSRAQDANGEWQTTEEAPPAPNGASGLHTRSVRVG